MSKRTRITVAVDTDLLALCKQRAGLKDTSIARELHQMARQYAEQKGMIEHATAGVSGTGADHGR